MGGSEVEGNLVDVRSGGIRTVRLHIMEDRIAGISPIQGTRDRYLLPGLIDAHVHMESSLLCPSRFAEAALARGTTAVVSDPHEIANVLGREGIGYMLREAEGTPLRIFYTAPSCVPAPGREEGPKLDADAIRELLSMDRFVALGEVMDFRAVLGEDPAMMAKLDVAKEMGKRIDGHAPGLRGAALMDYIAAGADSDHECTTAGEAEEKSRLGMSIMVREGSAARDMAALMPFARGHDCMLVSDDLDAADLAKGHVDRLLRRAVGEGMDPVRAVRAVTLAPAEHYRLPLGELVEGGLADVTVVRDLQGFETLETWVAGRLVARSGSAFALARPGRAPSAITAARVTEDQLRIGSVGDRRELVVQEALAGHILGGWRRMTVPAAGGAVVADLERDVLPLVVLDRRGLRPPSLGLITGFGLKRGAIASSVAHDAHNIIGVGVDRASLAKALDAVVGMGGGLYAWDGREERRLCLPIAGLMSDLPCSEVAAQDESLRSFVASMGCPFPSPFMTLSFQDPEFRRAVMTPPEVHS